MEIVIIPKEKLELFENYLQDIKGLLQLKIQPQESKSDWLPKKEAAKELKVCTKTFDSYLKKGIIPFTQFKGKIYVKRADIEAHLEKYYVTKN